MNKINPIMILVLVALSRPQFSFASADTESVVTYGDLILLDQDAAELSNYNFNFQLYVGFESGNPLLDTHSISAMWNYAINDFFEVGLLARHFDSNKTPLLTSVDENFGLLGVEVNTEPPLHSQYLTFSVIPLSGRLNYFSIKTFYYDLSIIAGLGQRTTTLDTFWGYYWAVRSRIFIGSSWGTSILFDQEAESGFSPRSTVFRSQINIGIFYQW